VVIHSCGDCRWNAAGVQHPHTRTTAIIKHRGGGRKSEWTSLEEDEAGDITAGEPESDSSSKNEQIINY